MTLQEWIKEHREDIDAVIEKAVGKGPAIKTDYERRLWVINDEGLYNWAASEGVEL